MRRNGNAIHPIANETLPCTVAEEEDKSPNKIIKKWQICTVHSGLPVSRFEFVNSLSL